MVWALSPPTQSLLRAQSGQAAVVLTAHCRGRERGQPAQLHAQGHRSGGNRPLEVLRPLPRQRLPVGPLRRQLVRDNLVAPTLLGRIHGTVGAREQLQQ